MAKLSPTTETVLDGDVRLTRRGGSSAWQAAFKIGDRWVRVTTKCRQLTEAKAAAKELYMEYRFKAKHGLVAYSCRSKCSFRPPGVRRPRGFFLPKLNVDGAGYRSH